MPRFARALRCAPGPAGRVVAAVSAAVLAAAVALPACLAQAHAQAAKPAAKPDTSPSPAPVPAEPGLTTASFGDWLLRCQRTGEGEKAERVCEVAQSLHVQGQPAPIAQIAIGRIGPAPLRVTAVLPVTVSFPSAVQVLAGEKEAAPFDLAWRRCQQGGCLADAALSEDVLKRWRGSAEPGRIRFKDAAGREIALPLSMRGLGPALDALAKETR
ncbi:invasion associated locus B family protein [Methylobacterium oryzisoli]|uniref:invasion associated locus B family protein n=1 Tax=Methylobacterium oryzisoli TaxID=3385502 RepID=UPI0038911D9A